MEIKTLGDLCNFLNTLNEDQLKQRACVAREDEVVYIDHFDVQTEDYVFPDGSDGMYPAKDYDPEENDGNPLEHEDNTIIKAGHVMLYEDF